MRVILISFWLSYKASNQIKSKDGVPTHPVVIFPLNKIDRQFLLQVTTGAIYSSLKSQQSMDYGLFPVRRYSVHNVLGLYLGDIYPKKNKTPRSKYALEIKWRCEQPIVDARNGPC
jgi:hypothetical protein